MAASTTGMRHVPWLDSRAAAQANRTRVSAVQPRIVGGQPAPPNAFPYVAYLYWEGPSGHELCTGTVVSSNAILTAAHCMYDDSGAPQGAQGWIVATGAENLTDLSSAVRSSVSKIVVDPSYDPTAVTSDVALLVLSQPISAPTIRIATSSDMTSEQPGTPAAITGWGLTSISTPEPTVLQWAPTVVQSPDYCDAHDYGDGIFVPDLQLCTADTPALDTAFCSGDSGGPLIATDAGGKPVEIGIISQGSSGCDPRLEDFSTRAIAISPWALGVIRAVAPKYLINLRNAPGWAMRAVEDAFYHSRRHRPAAFKIRQCTQIQSPAGYFGCFLAWRDTAYAYAGAVSVGNVNPRTGTFDLAFEVTRTNRHTHARKRIVISRKTAAP